MQLDMHDHATDALARAAGVHANAAGVMATAAQYVDDSDLVAATRATPRRATVSVAPCVLQAYSGYTTAHLPGRHLSRTDSD